MDLFHVSSGLNIGAILKCDYLNLKRFISPFVLATKAGEDVFIATQLSARYADERIKSLQNADGFSNKMATEGLFEYIRCTHYSHLPPRYSSIYLFSELENCHSFADEFRSRTGYTIYLIEAQPEESFKCDMNLFTKANKILTNSHNKPEQNFSNALKLAELYWSGETTENSKIEYLLGRDTIIKDIVETKE